MVVRRHGGPDVLRVEASQPPTVGAGQVLVKVEAAGVAYADVLMRRGMYPETPALPFVPGYDVVGRVVAGPLPAGSRAAALTVTGGYATHVLVPAKAAVPVPENVDPAQAVALVLNYVTAHQMLYRVARVRAGETVLVLGAAGGVGQALLELAALTGVRAIGTASGSRTSLVEDRGAIAVDRTSGDVVTEVHRLAPGGVAAVFDAVGGPQLARSRQMAAANGTVISFGFSFAVEQQLSRRVALARHVASIARANLTPGPKVRLYAIAGKRAWANKHPTDFHQDLTALLQLLADGKLNPQVTTMPLAEASKAHELLESGAVSGKLVLQP